VSGAPAGHPIPRLVLDADLGRLPVEEVDVLVVGSGVAGLSTALALPADRSVLLVTKGRLAQSATRYAQGGIAVVLGGDDSPERHWADTMRAGAGLCDPEAVRVLVSEGGAAVLRLHRLGARFDLDGAALSTVEGAAAALARTLEGGHSRPRIVHAGGDATGAEVERALVEAVLADGHVTTAERTFLVDLVTEGGAVVGAVLAVQAGAPRLVRARAVVLASGGAGQLYASTTNPALSTGDGIAAALRAGAAIADLELVQFHPTALHLDSDPRPLVSEAMRGEGAVLRDPGGEPVMAGVHPLGDLAPRDVVSRGMAARMAALGVDHLFLDATGMPAGRLERRFPTIAARCRAAGVEPTRDWIPVSPAAHYLMGGVLADLDGRTTLPGLYAVGEAACTGVHGANRLASNSLLEGLVFAARIGRSIAAGPGWAAAGAGPGGGPPPTPLAGPSGAGRAAGAGPGGEPRAIRQDLRQVMTAEAGVLRSGGGLAVAALRLAALAAARPAPEGPASGVGGGQSAAQGWETANLLQLAEVLVRLAARREESRGAHRRSDHPAAVDAWQVRQAVVRRPDGWLLVAELPVARSGRPAEALDAREVPR
jgi:L-aspartate oxidase